MKSNGLRRHPKFPNLYILGLKQNPKYLTKNLIPGTRVYGEKNLKIDNDEFRVWDPHKSKLAAIIHRRATQLQLNRKMNCLYLGASTVTTISHLSDILDKGVIYGVEFSERSMRQLIQNTKSRPNIVPILADARYPDSYLKFIFTDIDLIYQDIAQPNQSEIALLNSKYYLKKEGTLIIAIKSQSISSVQKSKEIYKNERKILKQGGFKILESINIQKYAANHIVFIARKDLS